jgi:hypothetical protein
MKDLEIKVSIEAAFHSALKQAVQDVSDEYNIQVESVSIGWHHFIGTKPIVSYIDISTHSQ